MSALTLSPWLWIKANRAPLVKPAFPRGACLLAYSTIAILLLFLGSESALAAKNYSASIIQKSRSGKSFILETEGERPALGSILLLRKNGSPIVALRVMKNYENSK